ncbi:MAG TPA: sulfurtransferase TusA family protein, partial [Chromatiales bacterium]|nr:sulfurtransferase TusA family protein [Chromatiales bacterium]
MDRAADAEVDARGLPCPMPLLKAKQALSGLAGGQVLRVLATDEAAPRDFAAYAEATGHRLEQVEHEGGVMRLY